MVSQLFLLQIVLFCVQYTFSITIDCGNAVVALSVFVGCDDSNDVVFVVAVIIDVVNCWLLLWIGEVLVVVVVVIVVICHCHHPLQAVWIRFLL